MNQAQKKSMRIRTKELELGGGIKVKCPICGYRCRWCPVAYFSACKRLGRYLDTGEWK